jgi:hypothetical protein
MSRLRIAAILRGYVQKKSKLFPLVRRNQCVWNKYSEYVYYVNIKIDLKVVGWGGGMDWIDLAEDKNRWRAVVNTVMNL